MDKYHDFFKRALKPDADHLEILKEMYYLRNDNLDYFKEALNPYVDEIVSTYGWYTIYEPGMENIDKFTDLLRNGSIPTEKDIKVANDFLTWRAEIKKI